MGIFTGQLANVVEWQEFREDMIFYKWSNKEIKKGSRLIIRPGQDAIFMFNGKIEGIFKDDGDYDIESDIVPFLSTLKGFKFGFNSGMRAEVLFINTKDLVVKWGTSNAINIPAGSANMPGGIPVRAHGTFTFKVGDYIRLIDKVAGIRSDYYINDVKIRMTSIVDQLLMKWITKEGKDMFNLQANSFDIAKGIQTDLGMELFDIGLSITNFTIMSFSYPEEIQKMINKNASQGMIGDLNRYQQVAMADSISAGNSSGGRTAADMAGMMMGMQMANQMVQNMNNNSDMPQTAGNNSNARQTGGDSSENAKAFNFCPECGQKTNGAKFCPECGKKLI